MPLSGKKIILGVTGSIAAYKTPLLVRQLIKKGADVEVIMTDAAKDFVTPLTLSTVSTHPIHCEPYNAKNGSWDSHVTLGTTADLLLIAPISANTIAKMRMGIADNLLLTTYLAATCPVMIAPAMDLDMFKHEITQENINTLRKRGITIIEPQSGELASGLVGQGRMEEPDVIAEKVVQFFNNKKRFLNKKVLVTAGPTYENIDPVRFIGNYSSGKMGVSIAEAFAQQGAEVTLVAGPNVAKVSENMQRMDVISAQNMFEVVKEQYDKVDIVVMAAAVADYTITHPESQKIKKQDTNLTLTLSKTTDILKYLGTHKKHQFIVGFALETENYEENAIKKLKSKNADLLILNAANKKGSGFGTDTNIITIFNKNGDKKSYPMKPKKEVALDIIEHIYEFMK